MFYYFYVYLRYENVKFDICYALVRPRQQMSV